MVLEIEKNRPLCDIDDEAAEEIAKKKSMLDSSVQINDFSEDENQESSNSTAAVGKKSLVTRNKRQSNIQSASYQSNDDEQLPLSSSSHQDKSSKQKIPVNKFTVIFSNYNIFIHCKFCFFK